MSVPGRVTVTRRALTSVLAAVAAERLGVRAGAVRVELSDDATRLGVRIDAPASTPAGGPSLRELGETVRAAVSGDGARITGAEIGRVRVRITGHRTSGGRVR
jgi:hypothetical protein